MGLVKWLLNRAYRRQWGEAADGISLDQANAWSVTECDREIEPDSVYRQLAALLPEDANICLEVISPHEEVRAFLTERAAEGPAVVQPGTIWPRPEFFHVQATPENLAGLSELARTHSPIRMGHHVYAYKGSTMLLAWHDFPDPGCLAISRELPGDAVRYFCDSLGCVATRGEE